MKGLVMSETVFQIQLKGTSPLVMHANTLANPLAPEKKQLSALTNKRPKTDADYLAIQKIEFNAGIYWDHLLGLYLPIANLRQMLIEGAAKFKKKKPFQSGLWIQNDAPLLIGGDEKLSIPELFEKYAWYTQAKNGKSTIMRTRPRFATWECTFGVEVEPNMLDAEDLKSAIEYAGKAVGIGDAKTLGYGRFMATVTASGASSLSRMAEQK